LVEDQAMTDIVERLHNYRPFNHFKDGPLVRDAAAEIERLRREVQEARAKALEEAREKLVRLQDWLLSPHFASNQPIGSAIERTAVGLAIREIDELMKGRAP
jgi:hypothetical protein